MHSPARQTRFARAGERGGVWARGERAPTLVVLVALPLSALTLAWPGHVVQAGASAALETAGAICGVAAVVLLLRCFRQSWRLRDLLLALALAVAVVTDLAFCAAPALADVQRPLAGVTAHAVLALLVGLGFSAAALARERILRGGLRRPLIIAGLGALAAVAVAEAYELVAGVRPVTGTLSSAQATGLAHSPGVLAAVAGAAALLALAAAGFAGRAMWGALEARLLAAATLLLAVSRLEQLLLPAAAATWVTPSDGLRVLAYAAFLTVAIRVTVAMRRDLARSMIAVERERLARDLHDGLAQDLAVIALHAQAIRSEAGGEHPLALAARRALAVARGAITDLSASSAPTAEAALREVAAELAATFALEVAVAIEPGARPHLADGASGERDELVRIAREAIVNAAHGGARHVRITLDHQDSSVRLRIRDDGVGVRAGSSARGGGFGVPTMHARAAALGGRLTLSEPPDGGTEVEVRVPDADGTPPADVARGATATGPRARPRPRPDTLERGER